MLDTHAGCTLIAHMPISPSRILYNVNLRISARIRRFRIWCSRSSDCVITCRGGDLCEKRRWNALRPLLMNMQMRKVGLSIKSACVRPRPPALSFFSESHQTLIGGEQRRKERKRKERKCRTASSARPNRGRTPSEWRRGVRSWKRSTPHWDMHAQRAAQTNSWCAAERQNSEMESIKNV